MPVLFLLIYSITSHAQVACPPSSGTTSMAAEMCWADHYARAYGVPLEFVQAVIDVESAWQPYVVSAKGAAGLMQLTAPTRKSIATFA